MLLYIKNPWAASQTENQVLNHILGREYVAANHHRWHLNA